jgi:hypothetical protein
MVKAVFAFGIMLLVCANARADGLYCATMIALGKQSVPKPLIVRMRLEIGLQWTRTTGGPLEAAEMDEIIFACVDNPASSIQAVIQSLATAKPGTEASVCSR